MYGTSVAAVEDVARRGQVTAELLNQKKELFNMTRVQSPYLFSSPAFPAGARWKVRM